ncbi:MAG TPA: tRNA (adenosine(37)-N6)-threonylcarbamoyltransferase complex transferase subunit TsaD [bacterium]
MTRIVGIETSCDETAVGIVDDGRTVAGQAVASSLELHAPYGGVIPEIAARAHVEALWPVFEEALARARTDPGSIDAVAVTQGPGLPGALLIGVAFAKGLAMALDRPLIPVDHLAAHLYAGEMTDADLAPPYVGLVVSGGHTLLCAVYEDWRIDVLGETRDDAVGEAFDKVGKLLGLGYPGGPAIDRLSEEAAPPPIAFPRAQTKQAMDFSFSGLKTAVYQHVEKALAARRKSGESAPVLSRADAAGIAAGFQDAAVEMLVTRTLRACQRTGLPRIAVGGGVAANRRLRQKLGDAAAAKRLRVTFPPPELCVDNGAMVAGLGAQLLRRGRVAALTLNADANLCLA